MLMEFKRANKINLKMMMTKNNMEMKMMILKVMKKMMITSKRNQAKSQKRKENDQFILIVLFDIHMVNLIF